jgi:hypothetical protein
MSVQESGRARWLTGWIAAAVTAAAGVLLLYLTGLPFAPLVLIIGVLGIVICSVGLLVGPRSRPTTARRAPDVAAVAGAVVAGAALMVVLLIQVGWPAVQSTMRGGPCDSEPTVACFQAHPSYYQETAPGSYSTPASRLGNAVLATDLAMWPTSLVAATICLVALATGTRRERIAALGLAMGTVTVAGMVIEYLAFLVSGGE